MTEAPKRIGMFGGSFDPPHVGHIFCVRVAAEQLKLDRLLIIPTARQPHKLAGASAPDAVRCEMVQALIWDDPLFKLSLIEINRGGVSYTVDTLKTLARLYPSPQHKLYCLIGSDALAKIDTWRDTETIFSLARVAVMTRPGNELKGIQNRWAGRVDKVDIPRLEISSTYIRQRIAAGLPVRSIVGASVDDIIKQHRLYRN